MNGGKIKEKAKRGKVDLESKAEKRGRCQTVRMRFHACCPELEARVSRGERNCYQQRARD